MSKLIIITLLVLWQPIIMYSSTSICEFIMSSSTWQCRLRNLTNLHINEIRERPAKILDFQSNYLELSSDDRYQLWNLPYRLNVLEIKLNDNLIENVPEGLSDAFPNLKKIKLQNNKIRNVKINQFKHFRNLEQVCLDNNLLEDRMFENLTKMLPHINFTCPNSASKNEATTKSNSTESVSEVPITVNNSDTNGSTTEYNATDSTVSEVPISSNNSDKKQNKNKGENSNSFNNNVVIPCVVIVVFVGAPLIYSLYWYLIQRKKICQKETKDETTVENINCESNLTLLSS